MAKKSKTAVATKPETGVAKFSYGDGPTGFENQTQEDQSVPLITVLQTNSPQCEKGHDKQIPGAEPGMFFNVATEELYDGQDGLLFVAATTQHDYVEYKSRENGGGFQGKHSITSPIVSAAKARSSDFGKYKTEEGNELVETFYIFAILTDEEQTPLTPVVIPFSSTKIKGYKAWNSRVLSTAVNKKVVPLMANLCRLRTWKDKNAKGSFYNIAMEPAVEGDKFASLIDPEGELFSRAQEFNLMVNSGEKQAMAPPDTADRGPDTSGDDGDAPF
jgi:hypothetical protein